MGDEATLEVGQLFTELGNQLRQNSKVALIALALLVGGNLLIDQMGKSSSAFGAGLLALGIQLYVTREALKKANLLPDSSKPKLWGFWWMSLMSTLAIMLGCVALILPGLYLAARWFVAGPILIAEDRSAGDALRESWYRTRGSVWHLVGASLVLFGGGFAMAIVPTAIAPDSAQDVTLDAITYTLMFAGYICGWLMEVGAYAMITTDRSALAEVFA